MEETRITALDLEDSFARLMRHIMAATAHVPYEDATERACAEENIALMVRFLAIAAVQTLLHDGRAKTWKRITALGTKSLEEIRAKYGIEAS